MTSKYTSVLVLAALSGACGGLVDSADGAGRGAGMPGSGTTPAAPTAPVPGTVQPTTAPCVAPMGMTLLACNLPENIAMLSAQHVLAVDESANTATVFEIAKGVATPRAAWSETRPLTEVKSMMRLDVGSAATYPLLYRATSKGLDVFSLADGSVTVVDASEVVYFRGNSYVVRLADGTFSTRTFYRDEKGRYTIANEFDDARYFLGYTNMYDDQPTNLWATSLTAPTRVTASMSTTGDVGILGVAPKDVQNQLDGLLYVRTRSQAGQTWNQIVLSKLDVGTSQLKESPIYVFAPSDPEPRYITAGATDFYWVEGTMLYYYPNHGEAPRTAFLDGVIGAPAVYSKLAGRISGGIEQWDPYFMVPILDPGNPGHAMLVEHLELSVQIPPK